MKLTLQVMRALFALALTAACAAPLTAQVAIPAEALQWVAELDHVFRVGDQLESQRRWGEALTHYEDALRQHPGRTDLEKRLFVARLHYEFGRRNSDSSFREALRQLSLQAAAEAYDEVLLKIQTHYYQRPDWNRLLERGVTAIEVAFAEASFLERNGVAPESVDFSPTAMQLRNLLRTRPSASRKATRDHVVAVANLLQSRFGIAPQDTVLEYTCAAVASLDDYSAFLTGNQLDEVLSQIEGNFVGLGIELKPEGQTLLVVSVIRGGPAEQGGVTAGDRIVSVDGHNTQEVSPDAAADMLRGPEGSTVRLSVLSSSDETRQLVLRRRRVDVPSVDKVHMLDTQMGVGYLRLASFQKTTSRDVDNALWTLHRKGMQTLILDVRGNPGGLLTAAVDVADKFVSKGQIVSTRGRSVREDFDYQAHLVGTWRVPLIVLIDGDSASASEIFAGAIRDHRRGRIIGERSYGKGSVQGIFPLAAANAGVRLTTARFYSPSGQAISRRGVQPDIQVRTVNKPVVGGLRDQPDTVLNAALEAARDQLSQR